MDVSFRAAVESLVETFRNELRELGVPHAVVDPDWSTLDKYFVAIAIQSETGHGAHFSLAAFAQGGVVLSLTDLAEPIDEGLADNISHIVGEVAYASKFGVVWAGKPFRRVPICLSPTIPRAAEELQTLLGRGFARYDPPW